MSSAVKWWSQHWSPGPCAQPWCNTVCSNYHSAYRSQGSVSFAGVILPTPVVSSHENVHGEVEHDQSVNTWEEM